MSDDKMQDGPMVPVVEDDAMGEPMGLEPGMMAGPEVEQGGSLALSAVGAFGGAALGALLWFAVEHYLSIQVGYVAIGVGALAGWGAVLLGKQTSDTVGAIAAVAGLVGILGGSYGAFYAELHGDDVKDMIRTELSADPTWAELSDDEREQYVEASHQMLASEFGYMDFVKEDTKYSLFMVLFGVFGLVYGFKVGAGGGD